jgi:hypothetical protein
MSVKDEAVSHAVRHMTLNASPALKYDGEKAPLSLIPVEALEEIAKVLDFGSRKYSEWNWTKGFKWSRLYSSTLRHLYAHMKGENKDPETGLSHLAHVGANVLFLIYHDVHQVGEDDRHLRPTTDK